jgi:hypothetical protein
VIAGFFAVSFDHRVRRAIFAGQAGIQFVTMFLLVSAIILFGIMGTLEGRELSALLGGLSGYILGHVSKQAPAGNGDLRIRPASPPAPAVTLGADPGQLDASTKAVAQAVSYRWFVRTKGVDNTFRFLSETSQPTAALRDGSFGAGKEVAVQVTAVVQDGESEPSKETTITLS